jgi:hypothetical protein
MNADVEQKGLCQNFIILWVEPDFAPRAEEHLVYGLFV